MFAARRRSQKALGHAPAEAKHTRALALAANAAAGVLASVRLVGLVLLKHLEHRFALDSALDPALYSALDSAVDELRLKMVRMYTLAGRRYASVQL